MFRHFLKLSFRNLNKNKGNTLVNVFSLSLGITILLLIAIYAQNELSVDNFHTKSSRIFKVSYGNSSGTPGPLSELLKNNFPEIQNATHLETHQLFALSPVLDYNNDIFEIEHYYSVDAEFFNVFDFQVLQGDINKAINSPFSIILTESEALRMFKHKNPIGETVIWKTFRDHEFTVQAIVKNTPQNSSIQFNGLISEASVKKMTSYYPDDWGFTVYETYLHLYADIDPLTLEKKLKNYLIDYYKENLSNKACHADAQLTPLSLHPLKDVYFNKDLTGDTTNRGNLFLIKVLIAIGIVIMSLSIINYINLSTARASLRKKEIAVQKIIGSKKSTLIFQYLTETIIVSLIASIIGFIVALFLLPGFSQFMNVSHELKFSYAFLFWLVPGVLLLGIIAGIYPAFFLSSLKAIHIFKKDSGHQSKGINLRNFLVIFQFFVSITLIAITILIVDQVNFVKNQELGIHKEKIIFAKLPHQIILGGKDIFRERLYHISDIQEIAFSSTIFGKIEHLSSQEIDGKTVKFTSLWADAEFVDLYDLRLVKGRLFSKELKTDINTTILLNEAAVREFGVTDPFQIEMRVPGGKARVIGIVEDFNYKSLHTRIEPMAIVYLPRQGAYVNIKLSGNKIPQTLGEIGKIWDEFAPGYPFSYHFLDSSFEQLYKSDEQLGKAVLYFSLIAITIAILGILSLSIFLCESRIKEIGIRKINGAKVWEVILTLNKGFIINLMIAFLIACPIAWYIMIQWLENFAYKTTISVWIFIGSGLAVSIIALTIVSWQSWRFAIRNPVDTLRCE
jgi:putative ABC transport system permease protein